MEMKMMDKLKNLDEWNGNGEFQARTSAQGMMRAAEGAGTACGSGSGEEAGCMRLRLWCVGSGKETDSVWYCLRDNRSGKETGCMRLCLWCVRSGE